MIVGVIRLCALSVLAGPCFRANLARRLAWYTKQAHRNLQRTYRDPQGLQLLLQWGAAASRDNASVTGTLAPCLAPGRQPSHGCPRSQGIGPLPAGRRALLSRWRYKSFHLSTSRAVRSASEAMDTVPTWARALVTRSWRGSVQTEGNRSAPCKTPMTDPTVAPVQSVSKPAITARSMANPKSPSLYSKPITAMAVLGKLWFNGRPQ